MFSLKSQDGNSVAVDDLAAAIQAWSRKHQEMEEQTLKIGTACFKLCIIIVILVYNIIYYFIYLLYMYLSYFN